MEIDQVMPHASTEQALRRIRVSTLTHQFPSAASRTSISSPTNNDEEADMNLFQKFKRLEDPALQRCFMVSGGNSYQETSFTQGSLNDELISLGFLRIASRRHVQMDKAVWSMALQILEENQYRAFLQNGFSLKHLPDERSWTEDLVTVGLAHNEIQNIPCNFSPSCSKLSMLLLSHNHLRCIGDSFFDGMPALQILDLSHTSIEILPSSVCRLVNLTTLLLSTCRRLKRIPSLGKLRALKKLDLNASTVEEVPEDIGSLPNLTYLDLYDSDVAELNSGTLAKLLALQFLRLPLQYADNGEESACLSRLETLVCGFSDVQLNRDNHWSKVGFYNCDVNEADLQNYFQELVIHKCLELWDFSRIKGVSKFKHISLKKCHGIEVLFSLSLSDQALLENVEYMDLARLENLNLLIQTGGVPYGKCFSNLTRFVLHGCPRIKQVFPWPVLRNLKKLKRLYVMNCSLIEEIFAASEEEEEEENENSMAKKESCSLSSLRAFRLLNLPELKRFCGGRTRCWIPESCALEFEGCPKITAYGLLISPKTPGRGQC
ncbi:hypothetical protein OROGR_014851 [Orobanche gracilis]